MKNKMFGKKYFVYIMDYNEIGYVGINSDI